MQRDTYRNGMLTVIAVLLAVLAWTNVSEQSLLASEVHAQIRSKPAGTARYPVAQSDDEMGVSSIGERAVVQRDEIVAAIERLRFSVDAIAARLDRGDLQVKVVEAKEQKQIRIQGGDSK